MKSLSLMSGVSILVVLSLLIPTTIVLAVNEPVYVDALAGIPAPTVDGDWGEWQATDFFADMIHSGGNGGHTEVLSELHLRFDCATRTLYALVLNTEDPETGFSRSIAEDPLLEGEQYVKIDNKKLVDEEFEGSSGTPDFAWTTSGATKIGWEASGFIFSDGSHSLNVHTNVWFDGEPQTSQVEGGDIPLYIDCSSPTAITLLYFTAKPADGAVKLEWATITEVSNLGFHLYRAESADGPWTRLNDSLIPTRWPGSSIGAQYEFIDEAVQKGVAYYYLLEDVDVGGLTTQHGPVMVKILSERTLPGRPRPLPLPQPIKQGPMPLPAPTLER